MASSQRSYLATIEIDATPAAVWAILTDVRRWPEWVDNVRDVEGTFVEGERCTVHAAKSNYKDVAVDVTTVDAPNLLRVEGSLFLGAFRFGRSYTLQPIDGGATHFQVHEVHSGPLAGPAARRTGDLQPWFDHFALSLKSRAEAGT